MRHALKVLFAVALVFSFMGIANAAGIPVVTDPKNAPEVWTVEVYNNLGSAITSGSVVVWDCASASSSNTIAAATDVAMFITTSTTRDDVRVAGVVISDSIAALSQGTIAIWGPVYVHCMDATEGVTAGELVSNSDTASFCGDFGDATGDEAILGLALSSGPNTLANGGYGGSAGNDKVMIPIFVDPTRYYED